MTAAKNRIQSIAILGGGTAGWMTAAGLANKVGAFVNDIKLIESDSIGTVGVGEATLPHIRFFNKTLGIDEPEFMAATEATIKLGIQFCDWARNGDAYIHPFGDYGQALGGVDFHHFWTKARLAGSTNRICEYSFPIIAAEHGKFCLPSSDPNSIYSTFSYAYQFDAGLYAKFLRRYSEALGVVRHEGKVVSHIKDANTGHVTSLTLESGEKVAADLFIDCSGFRAMLIGDAAGSEFEDWSEWLPCDRAVAVACETAGEPSPFTRATAREAGWQWRIPLQHRTGNGYVYWSDHLSEDEATSNLLSRLDGAVIGDPKQLRFRTGKRKEIFAGNIVSIGLSAGFLEPLESTSIHLIQEGITKLIEHFPYRGIDDASRREYNRLMDIEYARVRDFLLLHYVATEREDSAFWKHFRELSLPESLSIKINAFRKRGLVVEYEKGCFLPPSWVAVFTGQRIWPETYDPRADRMPNSVLSSSMMEMRNSVKQAVAETPNHMSFLKSYGAQSTTGLLQGIK